MKLKTATLLGMIGAILSLCVGFMYFLLNTHVVEPSHTIILLGNVLTIVSGATSALFFYTLYKNQK